MRSEAGECRRRLVKECILLYSGLGIKNCSQINRWDREIEIELPR